MKTAYHKNILNYFLCYFVFCTSFTYAANNHVPRAEQWVADDYVANSLLQFKWAKKFFFDRFKWNGNEVVLDIGCGDGRLTQLVSKYVPNGSVIGMDSSESMIQHATQKYPAEIFPNLSFELSHAANDGFYNKYNSKFDIIVSFHSLHWVDKQLEVLKGIKTALKPDGKAFLRLTSKGWDPIQEIADNLIITSKWQEHFTTFRDPINRFSKEEYQNLVNAAELIPLRIEEVFENDTLSSVETLSKQIKSWLPHIKHLTASLQSEFLKDVVTTYLIQTPPDEDGTIHLYDCYLEVEVRK